MLQHKRRLIIRKLDITRRDFLNGLALGVTAGGTLSPLELLANGRYPPALTGMRGSHPGSFEVAHAISWGNAQWPRPAEQTDEDYDLVVVGGGVSGLSAALMYQQRSGGARVLVLDNHDDFGGHAKRNEFTVGGEQLVGYGGSQSIDTPGSYSVAAARLLTDVGIHTERFYDYYDQRWFRERKLGEGVWFSSEIYGRDLTLPRVVGSFNRGGDADVAKAIASYPISAAGRAALLKLMTDEKDHLPDMGRDEKLAYLRAMAYTEYLHELVGVPREVTDIFRDEIRGFWGVGWDSLSALEGYRLGMPATAGLGLGDLDEARHERDEPYIFHFPDGNAGVARAIVRRLIPEAVRGKSMEDLVLANVDYGLLDVRGANNRIRLDSTAVDVRHTRDNRYVDVTYVRAGNAERVRGKHVILACYNHMIPHLCPELPEAQREAIESVTKVPLVYINVALRNWRAFRELGFREIQVAQPTLMHSFGMDFPVSMGGYEYTEQPDDPTVIHGTFVPAFPDKGMSSMEQHRRGRRQLYEMQFEDFETAILRQMSGALEPGGFDAERDIAAITINRWPHGYAYEYNELFDPPGYDRYHGPHVLGARQLGSISIANSDAAGYAYINGAIDAAHRAVNEQLGST